MSILAEGQPSRQGYVSGVALCAPGQLPAAAGEVQPDWFSLSQVCGIKPIRGGGIWLNCVFTYAMPKGGNYFVEAACQFDHVAFSTGVSYVRSCSCPDGQKRLGLSGEERKCKHMIALAARISGIVGVSAGAGLVETEADRHQRRAHQYLEDERDAGACE